MKCIVRPSDDAGDDGAYESVGGILRQSGRREKRQGYCEECRPALRDRAVTNLGIFDAAAEAAETACNQKDLPSGRIPTAEEQGSTHAQREKQQDIHQIAAQQFRVAALKHLKVGVKGDEDRGLKLSGRAGQNGLIHNNKDSAEQYDRKPRVPPPSTAKAVMQNQQQDCD